MLTIGIAALAGLLAYQGDEFTFVAQGHLITLRAEPLKPFLGSPLALYSDAGKLCLAAELGLQACSEHFVGAVTIVRFSAGNGRGEPARTGEIHERVVLIDRSPGIPDRPIYTKAVRLVRGIASDIQLYGYDEGDIAPDRRAQSRDEARRLWMHFRQELYWNRQNQPFAVLEWRHTIDGIGLVCVSGEILKGAASTARCGVTAPERARRRN
jgi:hypothetical protein